MNYICVLYIVICHISCILYVYVDIIHVIYYAYVYNTPKCTVSVGEGVPVSLRVDEGIWAGEEGHGFRVICQGTYLFQWKEKCGASLGMNHNSGTL